ncbi:MAG: dTDP-4-dehydrorhamnose reductase [Desulfobacteraceae bacterium]|nr:dTDP-4-dehydrorhamnose reductase [Desulfobacteraceae bacterium]
MKILVTGSKGQLGSELIKQGKHTPGTAQYPGFEIIPADHSQLDITDKGQVQAAFKSFQPSLVVNAAAYTNVDRAETEQQPAFAVNRDGPACLAEACKDADIPLVHISTDFVFDGKKKTPYIETDPVSPLGIYAKSKEHGEQEIRNCTEKHVIIRTSWLYGVYGHNFVKTMLRLGRENKVIRVVADQHGSPTNAADLAGAVLAVAGHMRDSMEICWGTYHYCGKGITTWHGFAEKIFEIAGKYGMLQIPSVEAITTAEYPTPAKRPAYSAFDCGLIQKNFGVSTVSWEKSLEIALEHILQ